MNKDEVGKLREKSVEELEKVLEGLRRDQFTYRMQKASGQLHQTHLLSVVRRDIARVKTLIAEKIKLGEESGGKPGEQN